MLSTSQPRIRCNPLTSRIPSRCFPCQLDNPSRPRLPETPRTCLPSKVRRHSHRLPPVAGPVSQWRRMCTEIRWPDHSPYKNRLGNRHLGQSTVLLVSHSESPACTYKTRGWCCERELPSSSGTACRRPSPRGNMCPPGILRRYPQRPQIEPEKTSQRHMRGTCLDSKRPLETSRCRHGTHDTDQRMQRPRWLHIYLHCMPHTAKCSPPAR